jgi:hypothetical protein
MNASKSVVVVSVFLLSCLAGLAMAADTPAADRHRPALLASERVLEVPVPASPESRFRGAVAPDTPVLNKNDKKAPPTATVTVNCAKGDSINDALTTPAVELTVQVQGICTENVVISRNAVTLVGTSPATDGVRGDPNPALRQAVVSVVGGGVGVHIQKLSIASGLLQGLLVWNAGPVFVSGCDIYGNTQDGIDSVTGDIRVSTTTIHNNRRDLGAWQAGDLFCDSCTTSGSRTSAVSISGSRLGMSNSNIQTNHYALAAQQHGWISFANGSFAGSVDSEDQSTVLISAGTQTGDPDGFYATANSIVVADTGSMLVGPAWGVYLDRFSNLDLVGGSTITGNLECHSGANAFCGNPAAVSGSSSGCSACVKP